MNYKIVITTNDIDDVFGYDDSDVNNEILYFPSKLLFNEEQIKMFKFFAGDEEEQVMKLFYKTRYQFLYKNRKEKIKKLMK